MGIVSLLSTIIYVATFFTMFLAIFSYTAFKLREGRKKKSKRVEHASPSRKRTRQLRVYLHDQVELVGYLKWYDRLGLRMTLMDGREVTICKNSFLYFEELEPVNANFEECTPVLSETLRTGT